MPSIEERLDSHDERFKQHSDRLERHDKLFETNQKEIKILNERDKDKHERLLDVEKNYEKLENAVTKENKETRATMIEQTGKLFEIVEQAMGYQETRTTQSHELRMAKLNTWSTVFLKVSAGLVGLLSSGGAIYYIIVEQIIK